MGVLVACATAFLNWRNSPILLRTKEEHSGQLKQVVENWKIELERLILDTFSLPRTAEPLPLDIENNILFDDLHNHIPSEIGLLKLWISFKSLYDDWVMASNKLHKEIEEHLLLEGQPVLLEGCGVGTEHFGITRVCIRHLYHLAIGVPRGGSKQDFQLTMSRVQDGSFMIRAEGVNGTLYAQYDASPKAEQVKDILDNYINNMQSQKSGTAEVVFVERAKKLVELEKKLHELRSTIIVQMDEVIVIPILTGNCRHINHARESIWRRV